MEVATLSASKLERFRLFVEEAPAYLPLAELTAMIRGERTWQPALDLGVGFHRALEKGPDRFWRPDLGLYVVTGRDLKYPQTFSAEQMDVVYRFRERYVGMVHEAAVTWRGRTPAGIPFQMNLRLDGVCGLEVHDHKTTSRPPRMESYERSMQWRTYLLATQAPIFQYNLFEFLQAEPGERPRIQAQTYRQFAYPGMREEVLAWVGRYLDFVEQQGLREYVYRDGESLDRIAL